MGSWRLYRGPLTILVALSSLGCTSYQRLDSTAFSEVAELRFLNRTDDKGSRYFKLKNLSGEALYYSGTRENPSFLIKNKQEVRWSPGGYQESWCGSCESYRTKIGPLDSHIFKVPKSNLPYGVLKLAIELYASDSWGHLVDGAYLPGGDDSKLHWLGRVESQGFTFNSARNFIELSK